MQKNVKFCKKRITTYLKTKILKCKIIILKKYENTYIYNDVIKIYKQLINN